MYHPGGTIKEALRCIEGNEYVLPAIQREFVWGPDQDLRVIRQLDARISVWGVSCSGILIRDILQSTSTMDSSLIITNGTIPHCPEAHIMPGRPITAVLDGQQRLTAFNIGLRGSMAVKRPS